MDVSPQPADKAQSSTAWLLAIASHDSTTIRLGTKRTRAPQARQHVNQAIGAEEIVITVTHGLRGVDLVLARMIGSTTDAASSGVLASDRRRVLRMGVAN